MIGIAEAFCQGGVRDDHGFMRFPNATTRQFLANINALSEHENFFQPDFTPQDIQEVPAVYKSVIEGPFAVQNVVDGRSCRFEVFFAVFTLFYGFAMCCTPLVVCTR